MKTVSIITRRLKEGKTYEDFRKAWYHTVGFGTPTNMITALNAHDPREVIVMGFVEADIEDYEEGLKIDVKERLENPLDDVIEPDIGRKFGIIISEDDFSNEGKLKYEEPTINGEKTDLEEVYSNLSTLMEMINKASNERDRLKK
ncbi:MAG: ROK family protein [Methanobacterium sp.]